MDDLTPKAVRIDSNPDSNAAARRRTLTAKHELQQGISEVLEPASRGLRIRVRGFKSSWARQPFRIAERGYRRRLYARRRGA